MKYEIKDRFTGAVQFTAEIECSENASVGIKVGLSVKWAISTGADLTRADLTGAYLTRADLTGANLTRANFTGADLTGANFTGADLTGANFTGADLTEADLIDGGQRSDKWRFVGWVKDNVLQIRAGCRSFSIAQARAHWLATRADTPLGDETTAILDHIEAVARIRGLVKP